MNAFLADNRSPEFNKLSLREKIAAVPLAKKLHGHLVKWAVRSGAVGLRHSLTQRRHVILTFHRIRPAGQPADSFDTCPSMSIDVFREIVRFVNNRFAVVSLDVLCDGHTRSEPSAAITFDDGWRDNYDLAFLVLREFGVPATIFVTTSKIGSSTPFWQQTLGQQFCQAAEQPDEPAARELRAMLDLPADRALTSELYRKTVLRWKAGKGVRNLFPAEKVPDTLSGRCFLSADEIREMATANIAFGSHTVTHAILPQLSSPDLERELTASKTDLENLLGHEVDTIAYPDGQYSPKVLQCARASGYRIGCTTHSGRVDERAGAEGSLSLPRKDVSGEWNVEGRFNTNMFEWHIR